MRTPKTNEAFAGERTSRTGAGQSTEISDSESECGEKERVGWRPGLRSSRQRHSHGCFGLEHERHNENLNDRRQRRCGQLDGFEGLRSAERILVAQHWLRLVHAFAGLASGHHLYGIRE